MEPIERLWIMRWSPPFLRCFNPDPQHPASSGSALVAKSLARLPLLASSTSRLSCPRTSNTLFLLPPPPLHFANRSLPLCFSQCKGCECSRLALGSSCTHIEGPDACCSPFSNVCSHPSSHETTSSIRRIFFSATDRSTTSDLRGCLNNLG